MSEKHFDELFLNDQDGSHQPPRLDADKYLIHGEIRTWSGAFVPVQSPIWRRGASSPTIIGSYAMLGVNEAVEAVQSSVRAYDHGRGAWPRMTPRQRIEHIERFLAGLKAKRAEIINLLMWEICKTSGDAEKEVDRTIKYVEDTIRAVKELENTESTFKVDGGVAAQIRRTPLGVVLCCGPFNYPFNETYTTFIPALIMGNTVVMKLPRVGVLCHMPTLPLFQSIFPPGVVNVISGSGRTTLPAMMKTGQIDIFAFIGTSKAAAAVQQAHPSPHRLRVCLGLEAKNPAIILPDADLDVTVEECILGSLSFNGQRCTAIKIIFVHEQIADQFVSRFGAAVDALKMGLPWQKDVRITPLPEENKPEYIGELVADALAKGARLITKRSGIDRTFVAPQVVYPVTPDMRVYREEQFGPVVPITTFRSLDDIFEYMATSPYGQQAAVFSKDTQQVSSLIDVLVNQVSRVNLNSQCQRGPDSFPFTGRKDSAYGTLAITDALRVFSIRSLVATKDIKTNTDIVSDILSRRSSNFLRLDYLF